MTKVTVNKPEVVVPPPTITIELSVEEAFFLRSMIPCMPTEYTTKFGVDGILFPLWRELERLDDSEWPYDGPLGTVWNKMQEIQKGLRLTYKDQDWLDK